MSTPEVPAPEDAVDGFKALADPVRLDLFTRIAAVNEMSCSRLTDEAAVTASTVSYHVKTLKNAGLVAVRKEGRNYHYSAERGSVDRLSAFLSALR